MRHRTIHILLALVVALAPLTATSAEEPHCAMMEMAMETAPDNPMDCCDDVTTDACGEEECDGQCGAAGTSSPVSLVLLPGSDWVSSHKQQLLQTSSGVPPGFSRDELRPPTA